mmetsp:Transcript_45038/g.134422  ORF Transcript_45038/g.134422 Transcript_45038/m.134422 type:complete len:211 (+) Transcript_45038:243-875(+)
MRHARRSQRLGRIADVATAVCSVDIWRMMGGSTDESSTPLRMLLMTRPVSSSMPPPWCPVTRSPAHSSTPSRRHASTSSGFAFAAFAAVTGVAADAGSPSVAGTCTSMHGVGLSGPALLYTRRDVRGIRVVFVLTSTVASTSDSPERALRTVPICTPFSFSATPLSRLGASGNVTVKLYGSESLRSEPRAHAVSIQDRNAPMIRNSMTVR